MNQFKPTPFTRKSIKEELKAAEKAANSPSPVKFDWAGAAGGGAVGGLAGGAAAGTAILPGVGTLAGALIGGAIGFFAGGKEEEKIDPKYQEQINQALTDFKDLKTDNLYAGAQNLMGGVSFDLQNREFKNQFQDARNVYADLGELRVENAFENMTVDQRAAQFQRDMFSQQQANIMQGLQGSAGGSGIAGLAQAMAQQGQLQAQQAAADIGRQERENQLRARGADMDIQRMQAQRRELIARGGMETQMARMSGAQAADQMLSQREQAIATGQFQASQARAQGAMQAQAMRLQGETDARNLEYQKAQGMLSYYSGQQEGEYARIEADKSWLQRTFGF